MDVQSRVERLVMKGTGCSEHDARRVARALPRYGLLADTSATGYLVEAFDKDRWWRVNGWVYDLDTALLVAGRQRDYTGLPHRVVVINHTEPGTIKSFKSKP